MQNFSEWLESVANIQFASWSNDGKIVLYANDRQYVYVTDAVYHEKWKRQARFAPGKVLNEILGQVKAGHAYRLEPPTTNKPNIELNRKDEGCPECGTSAPNYQSGLECPGCGYNERL